jgi:BAI1-associated protein 3
MMVENFRCANNNGEMICSDQDDLQHVKNLLQLHGYETSELIHQYYKDRLAEQNAMEDSPFGMLTIQCFFKQNILEVEIMSARNLLPMNSDGTCDAFVKLHFWPEEKFTNVTKPKTNSQNKTLFPLFDEGFVM